MKEKLMTQKEIITAAYEAVSEKKGENIRVIDISELSVIADVFIIASADNQIQLNAIADNVAEKLALKGLHASDKEGGKGSTWILMDYGDVVIHLFTREAREFYDLDRIWSDGKNVEI